MCNCEAGEQHVLNNSLPSQAHPKEWQTQTTEKVPSLFHPFNIPCENHTLSNTGQNVISQDIIFFLEDYFFFFLVDHTKNNPSGKDVVWLSEKAAPSPYKFSLQVLLSMTERFIISMWSLNVCEVPQNCEQGLVMLRRTTLSLLGIFCTFVKLKVLSKAPWLESGSCCNPNNWLWDCKCCVLFLCAMFQAHSQGTLCSDHLLVSALFHTSKAMPSNLISQPNFLSPSNIFFPGHQWLSLTFCNNATLPGIMPEVSAWLAII